MDINPTMVLQGIATIFFCMLIAFFLSQIMLFPKEDKDRKLRTFNVEYIENGRTYYIFDVIAYDWMDACEIVCEKNNLQVDQLVQVSVRIRINSGVSSYRILDVDFSKLPKYVNPNKEYLTRCAKELQQAFKSSSIWVKVTSESKNGPAWYDESIGREFEIFGIDTQSIPQLYLTKAGDGIPFACAELVKGK
jgi:hypothetical protein